MKSMRAMLLAILTGAAVGACGGDDDDPCAEVTSGDIADCLPLLSHVVSVEEKDPNYQGSYRFFEIGFDQPVDHDNPDGQRFTQFLTLRHEDEQAPFVLGSTGYWNYWQDAPMEPTELLEANQLIVEHRYFLPSRPEPADWDDLRVVQASADHHAIVESLRSVYDGPWISTGGSKGGMTSIYHRSLYPDDVDGTVAYVAPYNQTAGDTRYDAWFDDVLPADCLQGVRDVQVEFLTTRRAALVERATAEAELDGTPYTLVSLPAAVESAIAGIEWTFFQYTGVGFCDTLPGPDTTDDEAWAWLAEVNHPDGLSDDNVINFQPYVYQAIAELGFPSTADEHLDGLLEFGNEAYAATDPPELPTTYDPSAVDAAAEWVRDDGSEVIFLYGEFDPWTAGAFDLGDNDAVATYTVPEGTHQSSLLDLPEADRDAALATLEVWTGVTPRLPTALRSLRLEPRPREPRPPLHAWLRALRARRASR